MNMHVLQLKHNNIYTFVRRSMHSSVFLLPPFVFLSIFIDTLLQVDKAWQTFCIWFNELKCFTWHKKNAINCSKWLCITYIYTTTLWLFFFLASIVSVNNLHGWMNKIWPICRWIASLSLSISLSLCPHTYIDSS